MIVERDLALKFLRKKSFEADREIIRLTIAQQVQENRSSEIDRTNAINRILYDASIRLFVDLQKLTGKTPYRFARNLRIVLRRSLIISKHRKSLKNDVIPISCSATEYFDQILGLGFISDEYEELNPDVKRNGINPYTHFVLKGKLEDRALPRNH